MVYKTRCRLCPHMTLLAAAPRARVGAPRRRRCLPRGAYKTCRGPQPRTPNATQRSFLPPPNPPPYTEQTTQAVTTAPLCAVPRVSLSLSLQRSHATLRPRPHLVPYAHHLRHQSRVTPLPTHLSTERVAPVPLFSKAPPLFPLLPSQLPCPISNHHSPQPSPRHSNHRLSTWRCASCCRGTRRSCKWGSAAP